MSPVVIDTSVIIDYTRGRSDHFLNIIEFASVNNVDLYIPTVVLIEMFVGSEMLDGKNLTKIKKLLGRLTRVDLNENIAMLAAKIGRENNLQNDIADFVIAATALTLNAYVATLNAKHYRQIPGLKLFDFSSIKQ